MQNKKIVTAFCLCLLFSINSENKKNHSKFDFANEKPIHPYYETFNEINQTCSTD